MKPHVRNVLQPSILVCLALALIVSPGVRAAVNDVFPGDYVPGPAGMAAFSTYMYSRDFSGPFSNGQSDQSRRLRSDSAVLLGARYFDWLGHRMMISVSGGWALINVKTLSTGEQTKNSGLFDPKVSWTMWPYRNQEEGFYLAVGLSVVPGWGDYDSPRGSINPGQNRDRGVAYMAWSARLDKEYTFEATVEHAVYGTNPTFGPNAQRLEQRPAPALTLYTRHKWSPSLAPYVGLQMNYGGERILNGVAQGDSLRSKRAMLGLRWAPTDDRVLNLRISQDTDIDHGFKLDHEWALRWTLLY